MPTSNEIVPTTQSVDVDFGRIEGLYCAPSKERGHLINTIANPTLTGNATMFDTTWKPVWIAADGIKGEGVPYLYEVLHLLRGCFQKGTRWSHDLRYGQNLVMGHLSEMGVPACKAEPKEPPAAGACHPVGFKASMLDVPGSEIPSPHSPVFGVKDLRVDKDAPSPMDGYPSDKAHRGHGGGTLPGWVVASVLTGGREQREGKHKSFATNIVVISGVAVVLRGSEGDGCATSEILLLFGWWLGARRCWQQDALDYAQQLAEISRLLLTLAYVEQFTIGRFLDEGHPAASNQMVILVFDAQRPYEEQMTGLPTSLK
ncbi:hypothetical protein PG985_008702 [Apiospora marii]|uniref:uncharacterized protein n=1 Tax=Apiospora marii TaxID=335849 RepID=UPI00312EE5D9